ncbi:MAG: fimbrial protein [Porphyromonas endodontalis]|uniref:fimbrial protein n=1 Tax=Porphyromonas endodontalis TaxID=28124 RepID=UPI0036097592
MKAKVLMTGLISLALMVVGCKNNKEVEPKEKGNAKVSVVVAGNASGMRAYGDEDGEKHIEKLTAIVYKGEVQEAFKEGEPGVAEVKNIECTAGNRTLVVLANVPASMDLVGKTKTELKQMTYDLAGDAETHGKLLMTSEFKDITLKAGNNYYGYDNSVGTPEEQIAVDAPLQIKRVHAAIAFEGVKVQFKPEYKDFSVKFDDGMVLALIAKKNSMIFGSSLYNAANQDYLYGAAVPHGTLTPANYTEAAWLKTAINQVDIKDSGMKKGFYVLENASTAHPTILCLKGTLVQKDGSDLTPEQMAKAFAAGWIVAADDATTYYPVIINATSNHYNYNGGDGQRDKIVRNTKYNVMLTITGPGTNKPEVKPDEKANLDVLCKIVDWVIITQNATW